MSLSPAHGFDVARAAFECSMFNRLTHLIARAGLWAVSNFTASDFGLSAVGAVLLAVALRSVAWKDAEGSVSPLPAVGLAFLFLGYAPYVLDSKYTPAVFDAGNRLNLVGSLGASCLLVWALSLLKTAGRRAGATALALTAAFCFFFADRVSIAQWARASSRQEDILRRLVPAVERICPEGGDILLYGFEERVGSAVVFESTYDLRGALSLRRACPGLRAWVGQGRVRYESGGAVLSWFLEFPLSYDRLYGYDARSGDLARLAGPETGEAFALGAGLK